MSTAGADLLLRDPRRAIGAGGARLGFAIGIVAMILIAVAPTVAPQDTLSTSAAVLHPPSAAHLLGTDRLGRDVFSRFLAGGRLIEILSISAGLLAAGLGAVVGLTSGYVGGVVDLILMRGVDVLLALPPILLILVVAAVLPRSNVTVVVLVGVLLAPGAARVLRGLAQQYAAREFVAAAEAAGARWYEVLAHEIMPNVRGRLLLEVALRTGFAVVLI
ncbi:MAG: ABC transporter permease subunit, partial [Vulcanimicrobiaceae bacterium]